MAESKPGPAPPQGGDGPPESRLAEDFRRRRAVPLVPTVRRVEGGFRVGSSCRDMCYLVSEVEGHAQCTCPDYQLHEVRPDFQCKHILAVEMARRERSFPTEVAQTLLVPQGPVSVVHRHLPREDPVRIRLTKNTRGYSWEVCIAERDSASALKALADLEERLKETYGAPVRQQLRFALE
jgi:hypothetical protein